MTAKYPHILVMIHQNPELHLMTRKQYTKFPKFYSHCNHLGVSMKYFKPEIDDFDDIGVENLPITLRSSGLQASSCNSTANVDTFVIKSNSKLHYKIYP